MSLYLVAQQGVQLARQALAQGRTSEDPGPDEWAEFYAFMAAPQGPRSRPVKVSDNDWTLACCDAFRGAFKAYIGAHAARTLTDDTRGAVLKSAFELGANTALCERFATFTDSELSDLVLWVTTYGTQMAHEARLCSRCKESCFVRGCDLSVDKNVDPLPFPRPPIRFE